MIYSLDEWLSIAPKVVYLSLWSLAFAVLIFCIIVVVKAWFD